MYRDSPAVGRESAASDIDYSPKRIWKDTPADEYHYNGDLGSGYYFDNHHQHPQSGDMQMRPTMTGGNAHGQHQDITVGLLDDDGKTGNKRKAAAYTGRKRVWPGALFLLLICVGAGGAISWFGLKQYNAAQKQQKISEEYTAVRVPRKVLPKKVCGIPNYVTDKGKLYAKGEGKQHEVHFTGINWSGMENVEGVPHGLAPGQSYLEDIAEKLNKMEINAVRLPFNAKMVLDDSPPDVVQFVKPSSTELYGAATYIDMIKKVVQGLARKQIAVLLDLHKIDPAYNKTTSEELWYTEEYPEKMVIEMFRKLAKELCTEQHYNIIGVDLKNEPVGACWPANDNDKYCPANKNWPRAVERLGKEILTVCPQWLIVVEGLGTENIVSEFNGKNYTYNDWYGASLQNATKNPIKLSPANKIVYAPHFYSPSVYPSSYFFAKQAEVDNGLNVEIEEYPDTPDGNAKLEAAVTTVLDGAFGELLTKGTAPVFYGEFGGIYGAKELLKGKTSTRVIDILIKYADKRGMIGGFSWALNPDGHYDFNDEYVKNRKPYNPWKFGLYADEEWDKYNEDYAKGLRQLKGNGIIPCFARTVDGDTNATTTEKTTKPTVAPPSTDGSKDTGGV